MCTAIPALQKYLRNNSITLVNYTDPDPLTEPQARQYMGAGGFNTEDPSLYFMIQDAMRTDGAARREAVVIGKNDPCIGIEYITHLPYRNLWHNHVQLLLNAQHAIVYHQADQLNLLLEDFLSEL